MNSLTSCLLAHALEVDGFRKQVLERIKIEGIHLIRRSKISQRLHRTDSRRMFEAVIRIRFVDERGLENSARGKRRLLFANNCADVFRAPSRPPAARPSANATAFKAPALVAVIPSKASRVFFQQTIEHAPGEGAVTAAALKSEVDALLTRRSACSCCLPYRRLIGTLIAAINQNSPSSDTHSHAGGSEQKPGAA